MTTDQLLADILAELRRQRQPTGLDAALWDADDVAAYLRVERRYVLERLAILDLARMVGHRDLRMLGLYYNPSAEEIAGRLG